MSKKKQYDVIIIGGSYSGLAAALALGRALCEVLVIDSDKPCNRSTPTSHNFLTQDGKAPKEIATIAKRQVLEYTTIDFYDGIAMTSELTSTGFNVTVETGENFNANKLIYAAGINDILPPIKGFADCWGISVLHCPYCHGYEVRNEPTGILGNGDYGFEFAKLINNWTDDLTLFTNGPSTLNAFQKQKLETRGIKIIETEINEIVHVDGNVQQINFHQRSAVVLKALYARVPFEQNSPILTRLGCNLNEEGYFNVDALQKTNVPGIFACGDSTSRLRTVANAIATGTTAGMMASKEFIQERFNELP
jgi:thioredoxin reductase